MARKTRQSNKTTPAKNTKAGKAKVNAAVTSAKKATAAANKIAATTKTSSENTSSSSTARASKGLLQLAINWDTTGSMYPCLSQVKGKVKDMVKKVTERYNGPVEFRLSANGDYEDARSTYDFTCMKKFTSDIAACENFVDNCRSTCGYDAPEAYELALKRIKQYSDWNGSAAARAIVFISDDLPHGPAYHLNKEKIDWKKECQEIAKKGIQIYSIQCLGRKYADKFYQTMAEITGGYHLNLDQFRELENILVAISSQQQDVGEIQNYRQELIQLKKLTRNMNRILNRLEGLDENAIPDGAGFSSVSGNLVPVDAGNFQVLNVDSSQKWSIKSFVESNGIPFQAGNGFYEFLKPSEKIQPAKEVVLQHRVSGDFFQGKKARELIGLEPNGMNGIETIKKKDLPSEYKVFVQSTSYTRVLVNDSEFLYKVSD